MDFWDVVKLVWRRKVFAAPMLLLTMLAAGLIGATAEPDYRATGHVGVVPPAVHRLPTAGQAAQVNPWNEEALAHAASIRLEAKRLEHELAAAGYVGGWSVEVTGRLPVITIEVVAPTAEQAMRTMHQLQSIAEDEVRDRQAQYPLPDGEKFTSVRYQAGESVEPTRAKAFRALAAIMAGGLVLTTAVAVAADAVIRWRTARRSPPADPAAAAAESTPEPVNPPEPVDPEPDSPEPARVVTEHAGVAAEPAPPVAARASVPARTP